MPLIHLRDSRPGDGNYRHLEAGSVLFFERAPFEIPQGERDILLGARQAGGSHHKNIAYKPAGDKVTGTRDAQDLHAVLRSYSQRSIRFLRELLPRYMEGCRIDYASFRPEEEEGRALPTNKRNDLLHVDAFPTRPTGGDLILRIFTNVNPVEKRVWLVSDPFVEAARAHAAAAGLFKVSAGGASPVRRLLAAAGLKSARRTPYDRFMLGFHDYLKRSETFQRDCPKYRLEFPPGASWIVFTDIVPHAVLSGRYALEQTVIIPRNNLLDRRNSPVDILQELCCRPLIPAAS